MTMVQTLLSEFDQEMQTTRRVLERVPEGRFDWKPHAKSMSMGRLASHVAELVGWVMTTLERDALDMNPPGGPTYEPRTYAASGDLLAAFDANVAASRRTLAATPDARLGETWTLLSAGEALLSMPRGAVLRTFVFNHVIHHRGQLSVYLRESGVPVPSIYGPSADESGM